MEILWDKANSTYWWRINLDNSHPTNKPGVKFIIGYSKAQNQAEAISRTQCFCSKCEMLLKNGYIERCSSIVIYKKVGAFPNAENDLPIVILYKQDYEFNPDILGQIPHDIKTFMAKFYTIIKTGKPVENLRPLPEKPVNKDDMYKYDSTKFKTVHQLLTWCEKQIASGENAQRVRAYYREYIYRNFQDIDKIIKQSQLTTKK